MREFVIRLYTTAITGLGVYLWAIGPIAGPRSGYILFALIALWIMSLMPREWSGNRYAGALVQWTAVLGSTAISATLYATSVQ